MRGLYFDLWLLHPMLRACLLSLNKDLKSNDAKDRLAAGLRENPKQFTDIFYERKSRLLTEEIKEACKKKQGLRLNLFNSWIPIKR